MRWTDLVDCLRLKQIAVSKKKKLEEHGVWCLAQGHNGNNFQLGWNPWPDQSRWSSTPDMQSKDDVWKEGQEGKTHCTFSLSTALLYHHYKIEMKEPGEGHRGNLPLLMSPVPLGKRCITESPVHLLKQARCHALIFLCLFYKKKMCTSVWWGSGLQRKVCVGLAVSEQLFSLKLAKWAIRGRIIKDRVPWPEEDPGAILKFFIMVVNERKGCQAKGEDHNAHISI